MLNAARLSIRGEFGANAAIEPTGPKYLAAMQHADEVATILRQNVVQGKKEGDTYSLYTPHNSPVLHANRRPELRIHEETERGDNDSIKFAGKTLGAGGGKCCSSE